MPKIKNVSGQDLILPALGGRLVLKGAVIEVEADAVYGLTCQASNWEAADASAKRAHTDSEQNPTPAPEEATAEEESN